MSKVSVVIPNYNYGRFLKQRLGSILNQTYQDFEIIYIDDGSTDNSKEIFSKFSDDRRVLSVNNKTNSGNPFIQWNKGVRLARGEYIWIAEADDYSDNKFLEKMVKTLDANSNVGLAYSQSWKINENDQVISSLLKITSKLDKRRWQNNFINDGKEECRRYLIFRNTIPNASAVLFRKNVFERAGFADESLHLCGDWMTWVKMLFISDIAFISEPLNYYRSHSNSIRYQAQQNGMIVKESYQVIRFISSNLTLPASVQEKVLNEWASAWLIFLALGRSKFTWETNRQIYQIASSLDPHIKLRLVKEILLLPYEFLNALYFQNVTWSLTRWHGEKKKLFK